MAFEGTFPFFLPQVDLVTVRRRFSCWSPFFVFPHSKEICYFLSDGTPYWGSRRNSEHLGRDTLPLFPLILLCGVSDKIPAVGAGFFFLVIGTLSLRSPASFSILSFVFASPALTRSFHIAFFFCGSSIPVPREYPQNPPSEWLLSQSPIGLFG